MLSRFMLQDGSVCYSLYFVSIMALFCFFFFVELEAVIHTALSELTMRPLSGRYAEYSPGEHSKLPQGYIVIIPLLLMS